MGSQQAFDRVTASIIAGLVTMTGGTGLADL
jgi:hypothetical protein